MCDPSCIYAGTGRTNNTAKCISKFFDNIKAFRSANTTSAGYDDLCTFKVYSLTNFFDNVDQLHADVLCRYVEIFFDDLCFFSCLFRLFKYARTNSTTLRTSIRAHDLCHQVSAECRTGPLNVSGLFINGKTCAVCCKTCTKSCCNTRAKVTANICSTDQDCCRAIFFNQVNQCLFVCICCVIFIFVSFNADYGICTKVTCCFRCDLGINTDYNTNKLSSLRSCKLTAGI